MKKIFISLTLIFGLNPIFSAHQSENQSEVIFEHIMSGYKVFSDTISKHCKDVEEKHEQRMLKLLKKSSKTREEYSQMVEEHFLDYIPHPFKINYFACTYELPPKELEIVRLIMFDNLIKTLE